MTQLNWRAIPQQRKKVPLEERFWSKVEKTDSCWNWTASTNKRGYGWFHLGSKRERQGAKAHRLAYEMHNGVKIPEGLDVMHSCDNRLCVNPAHLSLGTRTDNMQDAASKGRIRTVGQARKTHCPQGHQLSGDNVYWRSNGHRRCRECTRAAQAASYAI